MEQFVIDGRSVGPASPPYIIAELGSNHNGDIDLCRALIDAAQEAGADAVKFQSWSSRSLISRAEFGRNTRYVAGNGGGPTLEEAVERYQLTPEAHVVVTEYCRARGITCFSSCFSREEVDLLMSLDVPAFKIASMDVNHLPLLEYVAGTGRPVLLSTGMATLGEVERALGVLRAGGAGPVALLHCVSVYPTPPELVNLRQLGTWAAAFDVPIGFSDHSLGNAVALAAVALGACIVEKHFTVDTGLEGWDHAISADPAQLRDLVDGARAVHAALGRAARTVPAEELAKRASFRRRMVARRSMRMGERLSAEDVDFKRPGTGIQPDELRYVLHRPLARDVEAEEELDWADLG